MKVEDELQLAALSMSATETPITFRGRRYSGRVNQENGRINSRLFHDTFPIVAGLTGSWGFHTVIKRGLVPLAGAGGRLLNTPLRNRDTIGS